MAELEKWEKPVDDTTHSIVGHSLVLLDGDRTSCRRRECNLGNLVCDALVNYQQNRTVFVCLEKTLKRFFHKIFQMSNPEEKICSITMMGAGGIRSSLQKGDVSLKNYALNIQKNPI